MCADSDFFKTGEKALKMEQMLYGERASGFKTNIAHQRGFILKYGFIKQNKKELQQKNVCNVSPWCEL